MIPRRGTLWTIALLGVLGGAVVIGISAQLHPPVGPPPSLQRPYDPHFALLGRAYLADLGKAYAEAWEVGAKELEAGQGLSGALDAVARAWEVNRIQLFDRVVTPEFNKLIPESKKDADVTPRERAAMAAAWRGFARGLTR